MADNYTKTFSATDGSPITTSDINTEFDAIATGLDSLNADDLVRADTQLTDLGAANQGTILHFGGTGDIATTDAMSLFVAGSTTADITVALDEMTGFVTAGTPHDFAISALAASGGGTTHTTGWTRSSNGLTPPDTGLVYLAMLSINFGVTMTGSGSPIEIRIISKSGSTQTRLFSRTRAEEYTRFSSYDGRLNMIAPVWCDSGEEIAVRVAVDSAAVAYIVEDAASPAVSRIGTLSLTRIATRSLLG